MAIKKTTKKQTTEEKLEQVQTEKLENEPQVEETIENGTGLTIMLSGDMLIGGYLYKKQVKYTVDKKTMSTLVHHAEVLGIAIAII